MVNPSVPRFRLFPVLLGGLLIFLVMSAFFDLFFTTADMLKEESLQLVGGQLVNGHLAGPGWPLAVLLAAVAAAGGAAGLWHAPLVRTFRALAAGRKPARRDFDRARTLVYRSPLVLGVGIPGFLGAVMVLLVLGNLPAPGLPAADLPPELRALPLNLLFLVLSGIFLYLYQHHRLQTRYLVHLFSPGELSTALPPTRDHSLGQTLAFLAVLSSVLPVAVVLTLLATGITPAPDPDPRAGGIQAAMALHGVPAIHIGVIDTWRILAGSFLGVFLMLGYVFAVFRWVSRDLTSPLYALRNAMRRVEDGRVENPQPVVSNNEVGELTLGFNRMMKVLGERDRIKSLFGQYLTPGVSEEILAGRVNLGGDRYEVTVLFTDIRDFTALSDGMPPEEVFGFLNTYLDAMVEVLVTRGGFIDKFLGDGILTVFGLPVKSDTHAEEAFRAALALGDRLEGLNRDRADRGLPAIAIGSGLHSGPVIAGNVGSARKLQYTVIGDTVNLASRIEGMNKQFGSVLTLSEATWSRIPGALRDGYSFRREEGVEIRGKKDPVTLYRMG